MCLGSACCHLGERSRHSDVVGCARGDKNDLANAELLDRRRVGAKTRCGERH